MISFTGDGTNQVRVKSERVFPALLSFLNSVFGDGITVESCGFSSEVPFFIRDGYIPFVIQWGKTDVLSSVPSLKKDLEYYQRISSEPCAPALDNLTSLQRRNLMENRIPFISLSRQVYLPLFGCAFSERFRSHSSPGEKMAPGTQSVFLYLYYRTCVQR